MDAEMKLSIWQKLIFSSENRPGANRPDVKEWRRERLSRQWFLHSARTALATVVSLYAARALRLPEAYWAAISTLVVMQSRLGAAFEISEKTVYARRGRTPKDATAVNAQFAVAQVVHKHENNIWLLFLRFGWNVLRFGRNDRAKYRSRRQ